MAATVRLLYGVNSCSSIISSTLRIKSGLLGVNRNVSCVASVALNQLSTARWSSSLTTPSQCLLPVQHLPVSYVPVRCSSFYSRHTSNELWKSVTSVSNQGAKKGRGRGAGKIMKKNLNMGQNIGVGPINIVLPGLNAPVSNGHTIVRREQLPADPNYSRKLIELRNNMGQKTHLSMHPLERGWSGTKMGGRKVGRPDPIGEDHFIGFESIVLEFKTVSVMTGSLGRKRRASVFTVTGNGQGIAGFALAKALAPKSALRNSKNKAAQQLIYIDRYNEHTVMHDFFTQFGITKIFVKKMPEGTGLICHRAIAAICKMVGIKDIYAKVEGAVNVQSITKAFFLGLIRQKTFQQLAEEKRLHLVELREENYNFPQVVASPVDSPVRTLAELPPNENLDFKTHVMGDRVTATKKRFPLFYLGTPSWEIHLRKYKMARNKLQVRDELIREYGFVRSFLFDKYKECHRVYAPPQKEVEDDQY